MEIIEYIIVASILILSGIYFSRLAIHRKKWLLDKYGALYHYVCQFFNKKGYEVCKVDLVKKNEFIGKTYSYKPFAQEEMFIRKVIIMNLDRTKYSTIVRIKRSNIFGTSIKLLKKEKYIE